MKKKALSFHVKNRSSNPAYFFQARYKKKVFDFRNLNRKYFNFLSVASSLSTSSKLYPSRRFHPHRFSALEIDLYDSFFTRQPGLVHTNQI